jgi:hypothetical protein
LNIPLYNISQLITVIDCFYIFNGQSPFYFPKTPAFD